MADESEYEVAKTEFERQFSRLDEATTTAMYAEGRNAPEGDIEKLRRDQKEAASAAGTAWERVLKAAGVP